MTNHSVQTPDVPIVLNLSDLYLYYSYDQGTYAAWLDQTECNRFYIGSYFCPKYFLKSLGRAGNEIFPYAEERQHRISITVPIPSDKWVKPVKNMLKEYLTGRDTVDEVVVNDYAMLSFVEKLKEESEKDFSITAGRLFFKNFRDPRYRDQQESTTISFFPPMLKGRVNAVELDMCSEDMDLSLIPDDVAVHFHYPFVYVTCTQYCEFASGMMSDPWKFRKEMPCGLKCMDAAIRTNAAGADLLHVGKGVFSRSPEDFHSSRIADRFVYWPYNELMAMEGGLR